MTFELLLLVLLTKIITGALEMPSSTSSITSFSVANTPQKSTKKKRKDRCINLSTRVCYYLHGISISQPVMDPDNLGMGAEAVVRKIVFKGSQAVSKVRIAKQYRHLILDQKLRSRRTASEARCLERAAKVCGRSILSISIWLVFQAGVAAPAVLQVDKKHECSIVMEFVPGQTLRAFLQLHSPAVMAAAGATEPESDTGDTDYEEGHPGDGRGGDVEGRDKGRGTGETETEHARSISIDVEVPDTRPASAARTPPAPAASPPPPSQGMAGRSQAGDCPPDAAPVEAFLAGALPLPGSGVSFRFTPHPRPVCSCTFSGSTLPGNCVARGAHAGAIA